MKPNYTARKSAVATLSPLRLLACILIIPIFVLIYRILEAKAYRIEFYDNKIVTHSGVLNTKKKQTTFMGVIGIDIEQTLFGHMFNYGDVKVDCVGKWDVDTTKIKNPALLEAYLQSKIVDAPRANTFVHM